ncbi:hypothetical protein MPER_12138 [Moniliophthora perniciosa FA553]|nr:hypothetical protein MPER_12138 [Moniliophthora perniciosa FA553]
MYFIGGQDLGRPGPYELVIDLVHSRSILHRGISNYKLGKFSTPVALGEAEIWVVNIQLKTLLDLTFTPSFIQIISIRPVTFLGRRSKSFNNIERTVFNLSRLGYLTAPTEPPSQLLNGPYDGPRNGEQDLQLGLLILSVLNLAKFNAILPIHVLTSEFLQLDFGAGDKGVRTAGRHFNLLLQAIKRNPIRSVGAAGPLATLLKTMDSRINLNPVATNDFMVAMIRMGRNDGSEEIMDQCAKCQTRQVSIAVVYGGYGP